MILLPCPWCGPRNGQEFARLGEVTPRPDVATATRADWRAYLYLRDNPCGWVRETWYHRAGCRRYLTLERHTLTNAVRAVPASGGGPDTGGAPAGGGGPDTGGAAAGGTQADSAAGSPDAAADPGAGAGGDA